MVFYALTQAGLDQLVGELGRYPAHLWVNPGVLDASKAAAVRAQGVDLTVFSVPYGTEGHLPLTDAVRTITDHHPNASVWIEFGHSV